MNIVINLEKTDFKISFNYLKDYNIIEYNKSQDNYEECYLFIIDMNLDFNYDLINNNEIIFLCFNMKNTYKTYENVIEILDYDENNISTYNLETTDDIFYYNTKDRKIMNKYYINIFPNYIKNIQRMNINKDNFNDLYNHNIIIIDRDISHNYNKIIKESGKKVLKPLILNNYSHNLFITEEIDTFLKYISELKSVFLIIDENNKYYDFLKDNFQELIYNIEYDNLNIKINTLTSYNKYIKFKSLGMLYNNFLMVNFIKNIINIL